MRLAPLRERSELLATRVGDEQDSDPRASSAGHHVRRPAAAIQVLAEREDQVWLPLVEHPLIAKGSRRTSVPLPIGGEGEQGNAELSCRCCGEGVGGEGPPITLASRRTEEWGPSRGLGRKTRPNPGPRPR